MGLQVQWRRTENSSITPRPASSCTPMGRREKTDFADLMKGEQESLPGLCNPVKLQHNK